MKTLIKASLLVLSFYLTGCGAHLRPDRVDYALPSGYDSVEITGCGAYHYGSVICEVEPNTPLHSLGFSVQGYYQGKVVVDGCGITLSQQYVNSGAVAIDSTTPVTQDCVLSITLSPDLPAQSSSSVVVGSLRGHAYVFIRDPNSTTQYQFDQVSLAGGAYPSLRIPVGGEEEGRVLFVGSGTGCTTRFDHTYTAVDGFVDVPLKDILPGEIIGTCVLRGKVMTASDSALLVWPVNFYKKTFVPLGVPAPEWKSDSKLCVTADENVTLIDVKGNDKVAASGCFSVKKTEDFIVRTLTVGGRSAIGFWDKVSQTFRWYH